MGASQAKDQELFIEKKKTLNEVKYIMETEDGFSASKAEYERQLKIWGVRKNMKTKDMKLIKVQLEARAGRTPEGDVYLRGVKLPRLEVQRKEKRCFLSTTDRLDLQKLTVPGELLL